MNINCKNCKEDVQAYLSHLPSKWAEKLADIICKYIICDNPPAVDCETFRECETLTSLSDFTVTDTEVCITYIDENSVTVTRCFDFSDIINGTMENIDPKCITDQTTWNNWSYVEKWQSIVDKVCDNCSTTTTTTTP